MPCAHARAHDACPTQPAHWWPDRPDVLAGRDLQAGGTWLGVTRTGRFAAVTNYRERQGRRASRESRGALVPGFLASGQSGLDYSTAIDGARYSGFSLLTADQESLASVSNRGDEARELRPGVFGLSNAALDTPWNKLLRARTCLQSLLEDGDVNITGLMRLLQDRTPAPVDEVESEDLPFALAHALTSPFIVTPEYGTRCCTALLMKHDGGVEFAEQSFSNDGKRTGNRTFRFAVPST